MLLGFSAVGRDSTSARLWCSPLGAALSAVARVVAREPRPRHAGPRAERERQRHPCRRARRAPAPASPPCTSPAEKRSGARPRDALSSAGSLVRSSPSATLARDVEAATRLHDSSDARRDSILPVARRPEHDAVAPGLDEPSRIGAGAGSATSVYARHHSPVGRVESPGARSSPHSISVWPRGSRGRPLLTEISI